VGYEGRLDDSFFVQMGRKGQTRNHSRHRAYMHVIVVFGFYGVWHENAHQVDQPILCLDGFLSCSWNISSCIMLPSRASTCCKNAVVVAEGEESGLTMKVRVI
jgi:hypothetical protein